MNLGIKIRKLRENKNCSQMQIAHLLDISQAAYNKWETGQSKPKLFNLKKLAEIFEIDFLELVQMQTPNNNLNVVNNSTESEITNDSKECVDEIIINQHKMKNLIDDQNKLINALLKIKL